MMLERAVGLTSLHGRAMAAGPGLLAFAAGRVVVLYDARKNTQKFLHADGPVSSIGMSADGSMVAAGQVRMPAGSLAQMMPAIRRIWSHLRLSECVADGC